MSVSNAFGGSPATPPNKLVLDENLLSTQADSLFDGATAAKKKVEPVAVVRNDGDAPVAFNVVLKDGTVENEGASIPVGGVAVVQVGGEINVMADFDNLYEGAVEGVSDDLATHTDAAIDRASISDGATLTRLTALPKQRIDQYIKLPTDDNGQDIEFAIMKPWGENGALIPQDAKSGDVLVLNGQNGSLYFNSVNGTLGNFVNAETGNPIPDELDQMKTAPLTDLAKAVEPPQKPDWQSRTGRDGQGGPSLG